MRACGDFKLGLFCELEPGHDLVHRMGTARWPNIRPIDESRGGDVAPFRRGENPGLLPAARVPCDIASSGSVGPKSETNPSRLRHRPSPD